MKTAISIPDEVFAEAERLARRLKQSRSELYSHALREYLARHGPTSIRPESSGDDGAAAERLSSSTL